MIKEIGREDFKEALDLVNRVFTEFVAIDYGDAGRKTFHDYLEHKYEDVLSQVESGSKAFWGYYENGKLASVLAVRNETHIALLFTDKQYQGKGMARSLFDTMLKSLNPAVEEVTVNSSPFAVPIYEKLGFIPIGPMQEQNGIRFTPMRFHLKGCLLYTSRCV